MCVVLRLFYLVKYCYNISTSFYSKQKNSAIQFLFDATIFTDKINADQKESLTRSLNEAKQEIAGIQAKINGRRPQLQELKMETGTVEENKKALKSKRDHRTNLTRKINHSKEQLRVAESEKQDVPALQKQINEKIAVSDSSLVIVINKI